MNALLKFEIPGTMKLQRPNRKCILRFAMENRMLKGSIKESPVDGKHLSFTVHYLLPQLALFLGDYRIYANMRCLSRCYPNSLNSNVSVYLTINYYTLFRK